MRGVNGQKRQFRPAPVRSTVRSKRLIAGHLIEESDERPDPAMDDKRRRCYYRLTPQGRQAAASEAERLVSLVQVAQVKKLIPPGVSTS